MPNVVSNPLNSEPLISQPSILRAFRLKGIRLGKLKDYVKCQVILLSQNLRELGDG